MSDISAELTISAKHATDGEDNHWPNFHPEDPDAMHDDWRPGRCERCGKLPLGAQKPLVRFVHCGATDCTGCIALCLEHAQEEALS